MPLLHGSLLTFAQRAVAGALIALAIGLTARRAKALTSSGVVAAVIVGTLSFAFGGVLVAGAIVIFFLSGSSLSRMRNATADRARRGSSKDTERDAAQVLANGAVATACAVGGGIAALHGWPHAPSWMTAGVCSIAAASGDTWSTEIGAFSKRPPRRISNLQPVAAGTSGGVTLLGAVAAPLGGGAVGIAGLAGTDLLTLPVWFGMCALAGLCGSVLDSVLGATLQAVWRCSTCQKEIETRRHLPCDAAGTLVRGVAWLDNDAVNAVTTLGGAAFGYCAGALLT